MRIYNQVLGERNAIILFFISCLTFHIKTNQHLKLGKYNKRIIWFICIWVIIISYIINGDSVSFKPFIICLYIISMALFLSAVSFNVFRHAFLKVAVIIATISILVQIGHDIGMIPAYPAHLQYANSPRSLYLFNTEWGERRLASIYWEPGQYQIILTYILCMFADEISEISNYKYILKKFGVIFLAFIMTKSTAGYLVLLIIVFTLLANILIKSKKLYVFPIVMAIGYITYVGIYNSDAIQEKKSQQEGHNTDNSFYIRLADNIALIQTVKEKPVTGWAPDSYQLHKRLFSLGSITNSNGVLYATAELGIPYTIIWIILVFLFLKRIYSLRLAIGFTFALIITQMNEVGYCLPVVFIYWFKYKDMISKS